jgi:very-short-patch-repair endonuclease
MKQYNKLYKNLNDKEKLHILNELYIKEKKSFADIADIYQTYPNKVRRDAVSLKIQIRSKSEAQKNALTTGKHKHPTKGTTRSENTKNKIGMGVMTSWDNLSETQIEQRRQKARDNWENLSVDEKQNMLRLANNAVRETSKVGSKLEKYILSNLIKDGYKVEFHKEQTLLTTKLQIDLFVSSINTAIEIDGPSHFLPVWGDDALKRNVSYDNKKEGLIIGKGWNLIRVKQTKDFSKSRANIIYSNLVSILTKLEASKGQNKTPETFNIQDT